MIILGIDTSQAASVALIDSESDTILKAAASDDHKHHVEFIGAALRSVLAHPARPELVVTGTGPGPFTGLRVGIAAGIAAGIGLGVDTVGLLSHAALAEKHRRAHGEDTIFIASDARRKEVYASIYGKVSTMGVGAEFGLMAGPIVARPAEVPEVFNDQGLDITALPRIGHGTDLYSELLGPVAAGAPLDPKAEFLAFAAARELSAGRSLGEPIPEYLREPDAKATAPRTSTLS